MSLVQIKTYIKWTCVAFCCDSQHAALVQGATINHLGGGQDLLYTGERNQEHPIAICHALSFHCIPLVPSGANHRDVIPIVGQNIYQCGYELHKKQTKKKSRRENSFKRGKKMLQRKSTPACLRYVFLHPQSVSPQHKSIK